MNINKLTNIIAWVLIILGIIFIMWKLFGGSPTEFSILITLISGIFFKMINFGSDISTVKERVKNIDNKVDSLASDFKEHLK